MLRIHGIPLACLLLAGSSLGNPVRASSQARSDVLPGDGMHAPSAHRIWGRVHTRDREQHEGFLRFVSARHAVGWADIFRAEQMVGATPFRTWFTSSRDGTPAVRTIELKGYRITWNTDSDDFSMRSGDFPGHRPVAIPYGSLSVLHASGIRGSTDLLTLELRSAPAGNGKNPQRPDNVWSGGRATLLLRYTDAWRGTTIEVEGSAGVFSTVAIPDVRRVEFAPAPGDQEPRSAPLFGTVEDRSGRSFTGFVNWGGDKVLLSDTLDGWFEGPSLRPIPLGEIRSIQRLAGGTPGNAGGQVRVTLATGEVVGLTRRNGARGSPVAPVIVNDPALGTVAMDWEDFRVLHLDGGASGAADRPGSGVPNGIAAYDTFDGGTPLRGTVVTGDGEEVRGRIRWSTLKEWSWDLLHGSVDGTEIAVRFGNIRRLEQLAFPDLPPDQVANRASLPGRVRVTLLDGRTYELTGTGDLGSGNTGILVRPAAPEEEPGPPAADPDSAQATASDAGGAAESGEARPDWRLIPWEEVRVVRFDHAGRRAPGS